ncbi:CHAT domain-containing protein [Streptomyces sp. NPDC052114]|uniref:CHAT domain-containing protein n=1 Tax=unclassified Streptomyces TaxID=2593676 RepID=UPI00343AF1CD
MPGKTYDLHALTWEVKNAADQGMTGAQDLNRLTELVLDRLGCATGAEAYAMLYADWRALPAGTLISGMRAGQVLTILPMLRYDAQLPGHQLDELRDAAREHGPSDAQWQAMITTVGSSSGMQYPTGENPSAMEADLARLEQARALLPPGSPQRDAVDLQHAALRAHLAQLGGGDDDFDSAVDDIARLRDSPIFDEGLRLAVDGQLASFRAQQAVRREDADALAEQIRLQEAVLARLPADHMDRLGMQSALDIDRSNLAILRARREGGLLPPVTPSGQPPVDEVRRQIAGLPRNARADRLVETGTSRLARALFADAPHEVADAMGLLDEALGLIEPDDDRWVRAAATLGNAHLLQGQRARASRAERAHDRDQGISWLTHALRLTEGPEHPLRVTTGMSLASAYRVRGDAHRPHSRARALNHAEARRVGLDAVRAASWSALLQSGTAHAAQSARRAGERALDVARWCLADGALDDAVRALDSGRGLVLHAATVSATVPEMLDSVGAAALADEWRAAGAVGPELDQEAALTGRAAASGPSSRLRRRALEALGTSPVRRRILDVPSPGDIGDALRTMGATALVYLVPAGDGVPGTALAVAADGTVSALQLPGLTLEAAQLTRYHAQVGAVRDAGGPPTAAPPPPAAPTPPPDGGRALERLCDWAGSTVMGPLLDHLPRGYGTAPTVALVPMGELGVVPWHAARLPGRRGTRPYACQRAQISAVPSARMLCEVAARPGAGTGARDALVVGDPTQDLRHAGEEAAAVHRAFHPGGDLLGPGTATPAAVRSWLRRQRGGVLHLACHGVVRHGERHSAHLVLSGGDLTAEELTEGTPGYRGLELVLLAACRTHVSGRGYDEAYSLATAFLVAGARSVIGSMWPVPDEATSLLMYMTHHYLHADALPPGQALRRAQLWMLNDSRQPPPEMPPHLLSQVPHIRSTDLTGWAGFTHLGW